MHEALRRVLVLPRVKGWLASSTASWLTLPTPSGKPTAHVVGPNPDRLLLVGAGIAVGYGAKTHDLALAGQLARQLSELTGRGSQIDVLVTDEMSGHDVRDILTRKWLSSVDAVVATPGGPQTLLLHSPQGWRKQIAALLDHVSHTGPVSLHVFIVAVPALPRIVEMPWLLGFLATHSARAINAQLRQLCAIRANSTFLEFEPTELAGRTGTGRTYYQWAELIAPYVAAELEPHADRAHKTRSRPRE